VYYISMTYRIILHVGPWKTGSSALQEFFYINRERLLRHGVYYPTGQITPQSQIEIPNFFRKELARFLSEEEVRNFDCKNLIRAYVSDLIVNQAKTLLLSSEDFANFESNNYIELLQLFSEEIDFEFELIYFDFEAEERLASYKNQFVRQGEFVDELALGKILARIKSINPRFDAAISGISAIIHRINYNHLANPEDIFKLVTAIVLNKSSIPHLNDWSLPAKSLNISISAEAIELLNEFNRVNVEGRPFDESCPVIFSDSFPIQSARFSSFTKLLFKLIERD